MPDRNNRNQIDRGDQAPQLQSTTGRPLPNNIEAEKSVLAACMLNPDAVDEIATKLVPENFFRPAHQLIYAGILELNTRHIPIDQISLADRLAAEGQLEAVGGRPYLVELANNTLALTNWKNHTEIVKRNSVLRDLVYASTNINALAYDAPDDTNEVIEDAEKMLFEVTQKRVSSSFQNITDLLTQAFDEIDELADGRDLVLKLEIDAQLLFQIHDHFDGIQRIDAQTFKRGVAGDLIGRNVQLRGQIRLNFLKHPEFLQGFNLHKTMIRIFSRMSRRKV